MELTTSLQTEGYYTRGNGEAISRNIGRGTTEEEFTKQDII
jgi:hypothetical protein